VKVDNPHFFCYPFVLVVGVKVIFSFQSIICTEMSGRETGRDGQSEPSSDGPSWRATSSSRYHSQSQHGHYEGRGRKHNPSSSSPLPSDISVDDRHPQQQPPNNISSDDNGLQTPSQGHSLPPPPFQSPPTIPGMPFPMFAPPGMAIPPNFSSTKPPNTGAGVSLLTPDMEWSQCNLPAFVWFELFVRAGAVLSAAAVGAAGPSGFYGWNGLVGVVAPNMLWDALRNAPLVPFQAPEAVPTAPLVPTNTTGNDENVEGSSGNNNSTAESPSDAALASGSGQAYVPPAQRKGGATWSGNSARSNDNSNYHQRRPPMGAASASSQGDSGYAPRKYNNNNTSSRSETDHGNGPGEGRRSSFAKATYSGSKQADEQEPTSPTAPATVASTEKVPSDPSLVAIDASGTPIPSLRHLPEGFLKDVRGHFGNEIAFHVTKPPDNRIYFTFRDENISPATKSQNSK
jgi:hypothetical protein